MRDGSRPAITSRCCRAARPSQAERAAYRPTAPAGTCMAPTQKGGCAEVPTASSAPFALFLSPSHALPFFCLCQNREAFGSQVQPASVLFKIVFFSRFFHQNEVFTQLLCTIFIQTCKYLPSTKGSSPFLHVTALGSQCLKCKKCYSANSCFTDLCNCKFKYARTRLFALKKKHPTIYVLDMIHAN